MSRKIGNLRISIGILSVATALYYMGWFGERRASRGVELPPFHFSDGYWEEAAEEGESAPRTFDTFFRSANTRMYGYRGKNGEKVQLFLILLADIEPPVHCYLWSRDTLVDRGGVRVETGAEGTGEIEARKIIVESGDDTFLALHWYMGFESLSSNFLLQQIQGMKRRLFRPGSRFLLVRVSAPVMGADEGEAADAAARFIRHGFPHLRSYADRSIGPAR